MQRFFVFVSLIGSLFPAAHAWTPVAMDIPVEVVEVRDLGLSDRDELKSVIEVRWSMDPAQKEKISSFNLLLSVTYADGTAVSEKRTVAKTSLSARVEVPSVKAIGGRPAAFIKKIDARVTAVISKK